MKCFGALGGVRNPEAERAADLGHLKKAQAPTVRRLHQGTRLIKRGGWGKKFCRFSDPKRNMIGKCRKYSLPTSSSHWKLWKAGKEVEACNQNWEIQGQGR